MTISLFTTRDFLMRLGETFPIQPVPQTIARTDADVELAEISTRHLLGKEWNQVPDHVWDIDVEAVIYLSPVGFRYYLPGLVKHTLLSQDYIGSPLSTVLSSLNRSPNFSLWETCFLETWTAFTLLQLELLEEIFLTVGLKEDRGYLVSELNSALQTIGILKNLKQASLA